LISVAACAGDASTAASATNWKTLKAHFTDRSLCFAKTDLPHRDEVRDEFCSLRPS
jgi:hypothetical protein